MNEKKKEFETILGLGDGDDNGDDSGGGVGPIWF